MLKCVKGKWNAACGRRIHSWQEDFIVLRVDLLEWNIIDSDARMRLVSWNLRLDEESGNALGD